MVELHGHRCEIRADILTRSTPNRAYQNGRRNCPIDRWRCRYLNCTGPSGRLRYSAVAGTTFRNAHCVRFHRDDSTLCDVVAAFVEDGAKCGEPTIVLATAPHSRGIRERLSRAATAEARFVDANDVLREILTESQVDTQRFIALLEAAKAGLPAPLRIFGEVVDLLITRGALAAALEIEHVGHRLAHDTGTTILCAYDLRHLDDHGEGAQMIADVHDAALPQLPAGIGREMVLLADHDDKSRELYSTVLRTRGYRVLTAADSREAVDLARTWLPSVILLDVSMPGMQATDAIRLLKGKYPSIGSSMAAFIANAKEDGRECIAAGFDAVIPKPCLTAALLADVRALCERPR